MDQMTLTMKQFRTLMRIFDNGYLIVLKKARMNTFWLAIGAKKKAKKKATKKKTPKKKAKRKR